KRQLTLPDKYSSLRSQIIDVFEQSKHRYGYKRIHASSAKRIAQNKHVNNKKKVVWRIMREENLRVKSIKMRKYRSYDGETSLAVPNVLKRNFKADRINEKWITDITEFRIPNGKVYLSPMID